MALTQVSSAGIKNAEVKTEDILDANITTAKIAADAVTGAKIADDAVGAEHIEDLDADVVFLGQTSGRDMFWDRSRDSLAFKDNAYAEFGTGTDLQIYHDGSNSYVSQVTAGQNLFLKGDAVQIRSASNEQIIETAANGAVKLYYDNSKKLETFANGIKIYEDIELTGGTPQIKFDDTTSSGYQSYINTDNNELKIMASAGGFGVYCGANANGASNTTQRFWVNADGLVRLPTDDSKLQIGASQDLQIYHNGSHSYIDNTTGTLHIRDDSVIHFASTTNEDLAKFTANGAVELYFDNSKKFETTSDGPAISSQGADNSRLYFLTSGHTTTRIGYVGLGRFGMDVNGGVEIRDAGNSYETMFKTISNGAVELYYDGSKKLETASYGASVTGNLGVNTTSPTVGYGGDVGIHIHSSATTGSRGSSIHLTSGTSGTTSADGSRINTSDNDLVIQNMENGRLDLGTNGTHRLTIKGDGKIGIGTDSPQNKLDVRNSHINISEGYGITWHSGSDDCSGQIYADSSDNIIFRNTSSRTERVRIQSSGGISFNGDTAAANALDDYEEGTWTPTFFIGGNQATYSTGGQQGRYTKTGRLIYCQFIIDLATKGSGGSTSAVTIGGLPFTSTNDSGDRMNGVVTYLGAFTGLDTGGLVLYNTTASSSVNLYDAESTYTRTVKGENVENSSHLRGAIWYHC